MSVSCLLGVVAACVHACVSSSFWPLSSLVSPSLLTDLIAARSLRVALKILSCSRFLPRLWLASDCPVVSSQGCSIACVAVIRLAGSTSSSLRIRSCKDGSKEEQKKKKEKADGKSDKKTHKKTHRLRNTKFDTKKKKRLLKKKHSLKAGRTQEGPVINSFGTFWKAHPHYKLLVLEGP